MTSAETAKNAKKVKSTNKAGKGFNRPNDYKVQKAPKDRKYLKRPKRMI